MRRTLLRSALNLCVCVLVASPAFASAIAEVEPNDTLGTAQNIDPFFSLDFDADIGDTTTNTSTTIPHVTIRAARATTATADFYSFTVNEAGTRGIFDIDYAAGAGGDDMFLTLFNSGGTPLWFQDDSADPSVGAGGSVSFLDSYFEYTFPTAGTYYVRVGEFLSPEATNSNYVLQVSVAPEPTSMLLFGAGLIGVAAGARRRLRRV